MEQKDTNAENTPIVSGDNTQSQFHPPQNTSEYNAYMNMISQKKSEITATRNESTNLQQS